MTVRERRGALDARTLRHRLRFGEFEARLTDADVAQLHDKLLYLHSFPEPSVSRLCETLRSMVAHDANAPDTLQLGVEGARKVQLAVYAEQLSRRPVSPALADARRQAFHHLDSVSR